MYHARTLLFVESQIIFDLTQLSMNPDRQSNQRPNRATLWPVPHPASILPVPPIPLLLPQLIGQKEIVKGDNLPNTLSQGPPSVKRLTTSPNRLPIPVQIQNPWDTYKRLIQLEQGSTITLAAHHQNNQVVAVRQYNSPIKPIEDKSHENILMVYGIYRINQVSFVVCEYLDVTMEQILACVCFVSHIQIATVAQAVLNGLEILSRISIKSIELDISNIVLSRNGHIKLGLVYLAKTRFQVQRFMSWWLTHTIGSKLVHGRWRKFADITCAETLSCQNESPGKHRSGSNQLHEYTRIRHPGRLQVGVCTSLCK